MLLREITKMALMFRSGSLEDGHYGGYFHPQLSKYFLKVLKSEDQAKSFELFPAALTRRISSVGLLWCVSSDHIPLTAVYSLHSSGNCVEPVTQGELSQAHFDSITARLIKFRL